MSAVCEEIFKLKAVFSCLGPWQRMKEWTINDDIYEGVNNSINYHSMCDQ